MLKTIIKKISLKICLEAILFLVSFAMGFYFQWEIANFIFFVIFIFLLLHPISSRIVASGAIIFLIATAILLMAKQNNLAEITAIWAYYCMIFTAVLAFHELRLEKEDAIIPED